MEKLYLADSYLKEFTARVIEAEGVILDRTAFYPASGGQPHDQGKLFHGDEEFDVVYVEKRGDEIVHSLEGGGELKPGSEVTGKIDWGRRYSFMRYHTSMHLLSTLVLEKYNSFITGNQISLERSRIDFNLRDYDKEELLSYVEGRANELIKKGAEVKTYFLDRDEEDTICREAQRKHASAG
jgi:misacylated tRNA(Ala) deacylase